MAVANGELELIAQGVFRTLAGRRVLNGVDLRVRSGEVVAIVGTSGAGKTTLFRCLAGTLPPDAGSVSFTIDGVTRQAREMRPEIAVIFQGLNLVKRRSALDNVLGGRLCRLPAWRAIPGWFSREDRHRAFDLLEQVGLLDFAERRVDRLSGGQQQRVAIARSLAQGPRLLIADEPVSSLDPDSALRVLGLLRGAAEDGAAILCSLHQPDLAARWADRIVHLQNGLLVPASPGAGGPERSYSAGGKRSITGTEKPGSTSSP